MRFVFVRKHQKEYPVNMMCRILEVTRAGFYAWLKRPVSVRAARRQELAEKIVAIHDAYQNYGSPRVHRQLLEEGERVSENTVADIMKERQIRSQMHKRFRILTTDSQHDHPIAENLLERDFTARTPDQVWLADITYVPTDEGWLYVAAVMDLCSRKIVGWSMSDNLKSNLTLEALQMAIDRRRPEAGLIHHSDRGVQYACTAYREELRAHGLQASMSRRGNCYDNAPMESFWGTLKTELVYQQRYATREHAMQSLFEYIEVFYNRKRKHSSLNYQSPESFEANCN
jgi:transposase InsO family protein